jgi:hypothetical protein
MRDELYDRLWTDHHKQFSADLGWLMDAISVVFRKLVAIEYDAPWEIVAKRERCADCA